MFGLQFGRLGGFGNQLEAGPAVPTDPITLFAANPALDGDDTNTGTTFFVVVTLNSEDPLDELRITIAPGVTNTLTTLGVGFAKFVAEGTALGAITEATFSEASGFASATTLQTSDWIDISSLGLVAGDKLAVSFTTGGSGQATNRYEDTAYVADTYFKSGTSWSDPTTTLSGLTKLAGRNYAISSIETRGLSGGGGTPPAENLIPMSFDDPMFSAMTEYTNPLSLAIGANLSRMSIQEQSGNPSIVCLGDNDVSYCRVNSREALRLISTAVISKCYLDTTGDVGDHADTVQIFSEGQTGGDISLTSCYLVAHSIGANVNFFCSDDWSGAISLEDVIIEGGPRGLRIDSDPGCHVDISLKNVYFVGPFDVQALLIQDVADGTHTILEWDNVRDATIENGALVPGALISEPASSSTLDLVSMFGGGDSGFLLATDTVDLYQDSAGTTPVTTDGQSIGLVNDRSGKNIDATASGIARPTWRSNADKPYFEFDGVSDALTTTFTCTAAMTFAAAFRSTTAGRIIMGGGSASQRAYMSLDASGLFSGGWGGQNNTVIKGGSDIRNQDHVGIMVVDGSNVSLYLDGVQIYSAAPSGTAAGAANGVAVGAWNNGSAVSFTQGSIYSAMAMNRRATTDEIAKITSRMRLTFLGLDALLAIGGAYLLASDGSFLLGAIT